MTTSYEQGLQPFSEMRTLIDWLTSVGVECHIVSASTDWLVKASAKKLGFTVLPENIYGIRVALEENEVLSEQEQPGYPVTFREGKVEVIERFIQARPIMVAGDADTDYEMLTLPDVPVRLIINRLQTGIISSLYTDSRFSAPRYQYCHWSVSTFCKTPSSLRSCQDYLRTAPYPILLRNTLYRLLPKNVDKTTLLLLSTSAHHKPRLMTMVVLITSS